MLTDLSGNLTVTISWNWNREPNSYNERTYQAYVQNKDLCYFSKILAKYHYTLHTYYLKI